MKRVKGATATYQQLSAYLTLIPLATLKENDDFVNDRHWNNGYYWIGWKPVPDEYSKISFAALKQWEYVCQSFTQKNVIGSNLKRLEGAIIGNEPNFNIVAKDTNASTNTDTPATTQQTDREKFFEKIDADATTWWTQSEVHQSLKKFLKAKGSYGKTAVLTYVPSGFLSSMEIEVQENGAPVKKRTFAFEEKNLTFEQILSRIKIDIIHYSNVIDIPDTAFGTKFSVVRLSQGEDFLDQKTVVNQIAVFYVDTDGRSYMRVVQESGKESIHSFDLSGNNLCLTFGEYDDALVTESVKRLQKGVNHAVTGANYALANINYPETTFINATPITKHIQCSNHFRE